MSIYLGQRIPLRIPFVETIDGVETIVDISGATITFDYWYPTTKSNIPDGTVSGVVEDGPAGIATGSIPAVDNTVAGDTMRIQGTADIAGDPWPAVTTINIEILERGTIKN